MDSRDLLEQALAWKRDGHGVAIATVVETWGSSPRPAGSHLVIRDDTLFVGSVSGGCVEGSVVTEALEVIASGQPRLLELGVRDEDAWEVGLACVRAWNDWLFEEWYKPHPQRIIPCGITYLSDAELAVAGAMSFGEDEYRAPGLSPQAIQHGELLGAALGRIDQWEVVEAQHVGNQGNAPGVAAAGDDQGIGVPQAENGQGDVQERLMIHQHQCPRLGLEFGRQSHLCATDVLDEPDEGKLGHAANPLRQ